MPPATAVSEHRDEPHSVGFTLVSIALGISMAGLALAYSVTAIGAHWLDRLGAHDSDVARFAARILKFYEVAYTPTLKRRGAVIHDALAAMLAVEPGLGEYAHRPVRVELRGELTRGTTVWDARSLPAEDTRRPVKVAVGSDVAAFQDRLLAALTSL